MKFFAGRRRLIIVALLFFLSTINYLDRQALSVLAPVLRGELNFTVEEYSWIVSSFLAAYTIGYLFCGRILDRIGAKLGIGLALAFWSTAGCLHAAARSWKHLALARVLLGLGESFNAPGGAKVIRQWIPRQERALSMAIFSSGNIFGSILAPPLVSFLALQLDWRYAFLITGGIGFVWLAFWIRTYQPPEFSPKLSAKERSLILAEGEPYGAVQSAAASVLTHPATLSFILARFLTDSVPYFFSFWLPEYLSRSRNFGLADIGWFAWIPYVAADLGGISAGACSDYLIRRGWTPTAARKRILLIAACLTPAALVAVRSHSVALSIACIGLVLAAHSAWITNLLTLMTESLSAHVAGEVVALSGVGGGIGGILANLVTGQVVSRYGYVPVFTVLGFVHLTAYAVLRGRQETVEVGK